MILPREAVGASEVAAAAYNHTNTHTQVGPLALAHLLIVAILPSVRRSNRIREGEATHLLSCGGTWRGDANGILMGLEPFMFRPSRTEAGIHEVELKPTHL